MKFLQKNAELLTKRAWESIVENYMEHSHKETVVEDSIDTYHASVDGFNLYRISLDGKVGEDKPYRGATIITGDIEMLIIPHDDNEYDKEDNKFDIYSRTHWYGEYKQHVNYLWEMWDLRKKQRVVYKHEFKKALLPDEKNVLRIEPYQYINKEGERMEITDLSFLRNHEA